ncbi:MAG: ROK family protein [Planctomycetaceae bacterium]|jgi:glucokinase|nr:ROK family protein [Planctomycetaceae bacterium]
MSNLLLFTEEAFYCQVSEAVFPLFVGVSYGGHCIKVGVVDSEGRTISYFASPNQSSMKPADAVLHVAKLINHALSKAGIEFDSVQRIGFSFPGSINPRTDELYRPPSLPDWYNFPVVAELNKALGREITVFCNDANAAAYAEYWIGAAQGNQSLALLLLGSGIGCGFVIDGDGVIGANGFGGEFGHIIVDPSPFARWCNCRKQGHLEAYSSSAAVARRTLELLEVGMESSLSKRIDTKTPLQDIPKMVYEEADKNDALAKQIVLDTAKYIGIGIVTLIHTIDPECVLIGGEMMFGGKGSNVGEMFLQGIRDEVLSRGLTDIVKFFKLDFAKLGSYASYIGAAGLAREESLLFEVNE